MLSSRATWTKYLSTRSSIGIPLCSYSIREYIEIASKYFIYLYSAAILKMMKDTMIMTAVEETGLPAENRDEILTSVQQRDYAKAEPMKS